MKKEIITELGTYKLALVTNDFVFYVNEYEFDENACVMMYDKNDKLISCNYFAFNEYISVMEQILLNDLEYEYIDNDQLENMQWYFDCKNKLKKVV